MKYDISDIPPKSVAKIFTFLDQLLEEENLNPEYLRTHLENFSFEERYFVCLYALRYFSLEPDTYLDKWLREKISILGNYDESQSFISAIINNVKEVKSIFNFKNRAIIEKNLATSKIIKNSNASYLPTNGVEQKIDIAIEGDLEKMRPRQRIAIRRNYRRYKRIPLYYIENKLFDKFKIQFFDALKMCLDYNSTEKLFYNTFEFHGNYHYLQLLNLKVSKKSLLESAIAIINTKYKETVSDHLKFDNYRKHNQSVNKKRKSASRLRNKFVPKKLGKPVEIQRLHFITAMYNAFPYLREAYQKDLSKNPTLLLDTFLKKRLKNIPSA